MSAVSELSDLASQYLQFSKEKSDKAPHVLKKIEGKLDEWIAYSRKANCFEAIKFFTTLRVSVAEYDRSRDEPSLKEYNQTIDKELEQMIGQIDTVASKVIPMKKPQASPPSAVIELERKETAAEDEVVLPAVSKVIKMKKPGASPSAATELEGKETAAAGEVDLKESIESRLDPTYKSLRDQLKFLLTITNNPQMLKDWIPIFRDWLKTVDGDLLGRERAVLSESLDHLSEVLSKGTFISIERGVNGVRQAMVDIIRHHFVPNEDAEIILDRFMQKLTEKDGSWTASMKLLRETHNELVIISSHISSFPVASKPLQALLKYIDDFAHAKGAPTDGIIVGDKPLKDFLKMITAAVDGVLACQPEVQKTIDAQIAKEKRLQAKYDNLASKLEPFESSHPLHQAISKFIKSEPELFFGWVGKHYDEIIYAPDYSSDIEFTASLLHIGREKGSNDYLIECQHEPGPKFIIRLTESQMKEFLSQHAIDVGAR